MGPDSSFSSHHNQMVILSTFLLTSKMKQFIGNLQLGFIYLLVFLIDPCVTIFNSHVTAINVHCISLYFLKCTVINCFFNYTQKLIIAQFTVHKLLFCMCHFMCPFKEYFIPFACETVLLLLSKICTVEALLLSLDLMVYFIWTIPPAIHFPRTGICLVSFKPII